MKSAAEEPPAAGAAPARAGLSACIIAQDEEDRIAACIRSVDFCDEVLVVDARSKDATREIASGLGARVLERDWAGFVAQKEYAVRAARHEWVLCVDCDERVSGELRAEIEALRERGFRDSAGWTMPRKVRYLGRWIRHGGWYPDRQLRLFDRRRGRWSGGDVHEKVELDSTPGRLAGDLLHHSYRDLDDHLRRIARYTALKAQELHRGGARASVLDLALRPAARFFKFYVLRLGFLDGWRGLLIAGLAAHYVRMKYARLMVLQRASGEEQS